MLQSMLYWLYSKLSFRHGQYVAVLACKYREPLHFHHDGCPSCWYNTNLEESIRLYSDIVKDEVKSVCNLCGNVEYHQLALHAKCGSGECEGIQTLS